MSKAGRCLSRDSVSPGILDCLLFINPFQVCVTPLLHGGQGSQRFPSLGQAGHTSDLNARAVVFTLLSQTRGLGCLRVRCRANGPELGEEEPYDVIS